MKHILAVTLSMVLLLSCNQEAKKTENNSKLTDAKIDSQVASIDSQASAAIKAANSLLAAEESSLSYSSGIVSPGMMDSPSVKKMLTKFRKKKDEFRDLVFYEHISTPRYNSANAVYLYFSTHQSTVNPLRLKLQYYADDWLFIRGCTFLIDGQSYDLRTGSFERDNDSDIWEWYDEELTYSSAEIVEKLLKCKSAKVRFQGSQYYDDKVITAKQLAAMRETVALFNKLKS